MPRKLTNIVRPVPDDLVVAQACTPLPISAIAEELGLTRDDYDEHGKSKAKARRRSLAACAARGCNWSAWRGAAGASQRRAAATPLAAQCKLTLLDKLRDRPSGYYGPSGSGWRLQRLGRAEP